MATSTNRILFAIVVLLFALFLESLGSHLLDIFAFAFALAGLMCGFVGILTKESR